MAEEISDILKKALALSPEARAALAGSLLESLDERPSDPDAELAWSEEIARRMRELDSGGVKPIAWLDARRQISDLLNGQ
jgi:putative addiction module component (TIGR02574 family)